MTGLQGIVDAGANVAHASSRGDVDGERKQALDETLLDNGIFGELGLLIEQGDDDLGQIGSVVASANLVEVRRDMVLVNVARGFSASEERASLVVWTTCSLLA